MIPPDIAALEALKKLRGKQKKDTDISLPVVDEDTVDIDFTSPIYMAALNAAKKTQERISRQNEIKALRSLTEAAREEQNRVEKQKLIEEQMVRATEEAMAAASAVTKQSARISAQIAARIQQKTVTEDPDIKDHAAKEHVAKDHAAKEHAAKAHAAKEHVAKDHAAKEHVTKDHVAKDHAAKEHVAKEHLTKLPEKPRRASVISKQKDKKTSKLASSKKLNFFIKMRDIFKVLDIATVKSFAVVNRKYLFTALPVLLIVFAVISSFFSSEPNLPAPFVFENYDDIWIMRIQAEPKIILVNNDPDGEVEEDYETLRRAYIKDLQGTMCKNFGIVHGFREIGVSSLVSVIDFNPTVIGSIEIEKIGIKRLIFVGSYVSELMYGVAKLGGTAPLGEPGNSVLEACTNFIGREYLDRFEEIELDDIIVISGAEEIWTYKVFSTFSAPVTDYDVVWENNINEDYITLLAYISEDEENEARFQVIMARRYFDD
jgi:hypothetical protein